MDTAQIREIFKPRTVSIGIPLLIVLIVTGSIMYGLHVRDSDEMDAQYIEPTRDHVIDMVGLQLAYEHYPNQTGIANESELSSRADQIQQRARQQRQQAVAEQDYLAALFPAIIAVSGPIIPLTPTATYLDTIDDSILFSTADGYVITKEIPETVAELVYIEDQLLSLRDQVSNSSMSYKQFQAELETIREIRYNRTIGSFVAQSYDEDDGYIGIGTMSISKNLDSTVENYETNNWTEVGLIHFIPGLLASFILYYALTSLLIVGGRRLIAWTDEKV